MHLFNQKLFLFVFEYVRYTSLVERYLYKYSKIM